MLVVTGEGPDGTVYWDGKGWTPDKSKAKRYERLPQPLIISCDETFSLAGVGDFHVRNMPFPGPKDWRPGTGKRGKGSVK